MKLILKKICLSFLLLIFTVCIIVIFSTKEAKFECIGNIATKDTSQLSKVLIKQKNYRWWVGLWNNSDGSIWLEYPNKTVEEYEQVKNVLGGDLITLWNSNKQLKGTFLISSNSLNVDIPRYGTFEGNCKSSQ